MIVLDEPAHYSRFGFRRQTLNRLQTPYDGPYLQVSALSEAERQASVRPHHASAFSELG